MPARIQKRFNMTQTTIQKMKRYQKITQTALNEIKIQQDLNQKQKKIAIDFLEMVCVI